MNTRNTDGSPALPAPGRYTLAERMGSLPACYVDVLGPAACGGMHFEAVFRTSDMHVRHPGVRRTIRVRGGRLVARRRHAPAGEHLRGDLLVTMHCPLCGDIYVADPGHRCLACGVSLVDSPGRRRRRAPDTQPIAPETVREEVTARHRALIAEDAARPPADRIVFSWPNDDRADFDDDQTTDVGILQHQALARAISRAFYFGGAS